MKKFDLVTPITAMPDTELSAADRELVEAARTIGRNAYAPYSHYSVGAAIRLADGTIVTGCNQENAAYPSGTCAERTAAYYAHAQHPDTPFEAIAIAFIGTDGHEPAEPASPCGACRQALSEYEKLAGRDVRVLLVGKEEVFIIPSVHSLLPLTFTEF
ncbi:MAG: cytidine deaminase [Candidatus Amulumruptor caecigallinarius]|nr:cytidine deaminase [Candidatus Amulumruptor caecigallinarius]MCM1397390.1 cytidine deaminase [Candidatus Amulumruptor caecigallinarius]MCM1454475.1 cytidine deaminase [bacterium]